MYVESLTPYTISSVVAAAGDVEVTVNRKVEADVHLILCPSSSDLELDVLLGEHIGEIRNVLSENNARTVAMRSRRESTTMMTHRWKQKSGS